MAALSGLLLPCVKREFSLKTRILRASRSVPALLQLAKEVIGVFGAGMAVKTLDAGCSDFLGKRNSCMFTKPHF